MFVLCKELNLIHDESHIKDYSLQELRDLISTHKSFDERTVLSIQAEKYGVELKYLPKFHCEMNPIESYWCFLKQFVRKRNDQTFDKCLILIEQAKQEFSKTNINAKLWRRFWQAIHMYQEKLPYEDVIKLLFGARTAENRSHRKIYNTKIL